MRGMSTVIHGVEIQRERIARFCLENHVRKLSLFGSILTDQFGPDSDVDVLVEFDPDSAPTYFDMAGMEQELSAIFGRRVDLRTPKELSRYFRDQVIASAATQYERK